MVVFAEAPGEIDDRIGDEVEFSDAGGEVPAYSRKGRALVHTQADMFLLHEERGRDQADAARDEDGFFIPHAPGFEAAQPGEELRVDLIELQLGVALEGIAQVFFAEMEEARSRRRGRVRRSG